MLPNVPFEKLSLKYGDNLPWKRKNIDFDYKVNYVGMLMRDPISNIKEMYTQTMTNSYVTQITSTTNVVHLSMRNARNTMGTRGTPE